MSESVELETDPSTWLGEPTCRAGGIVSWYIGNIVIVLSSRSLTDY